MHKIAILAAVAVTLGGVLWMKSRTPAKKPVAQVEKLGGSAQESAAFVSTSVLLFADPREAETSCDCAEVIRLARYAGSRPGVIFREFDTRKGTTEAKHYGVRVSPTIIITDADGVERTWFEGESRDVIAKLRDALNSLQGEPAQEERAAR